MGLETALLAKIAIGAAVGSTAASIYTGEKSRSQQKKANRIQERVRQTQDARSRIAQIREARLAQAQVVQAGATQGALSSSSVQGGYSAIGSNAENNIQFINQVDTMQQAINKRMESASNWGGAASAFAGVASISASLMPTGGATKKADVPTNAISNDLFVSNFNKYGG